MIFSIDQYGVLRKHHDNLAVVSTVDQTENNPVYQEMQQWRRKNLLHVLWSPQREEGLEEYKKTGIKRLVRGIDQHVKELTFDMLECERESFKELVDAAKRTQSILAASLKDPLPGAKDRLATLLGTDCKQIIIQANLVNKSPAQVAAKVLELYDKQEAMVPALSGFRQNAIKLINAATTNDMVDNIVEVALTQTLPTMLLQVV